MVDDQSDFNSLGDVVAKRNAVTYAEVYRHQKPEEGNPTDTPASGPSSRHSGWMYVSIVLGILSLILLTSITVLSYRSLSGSTYSSESPSKLSTNSVGDCTCPRENRTGKRYLRTLQMLMEDLCNHKEECDLCPSDWQLHRGRCYYFSKESTDWDASRIHCSANRSQLLVVEDEAEMEFIDNKKEKNKFIWLGLTFRKKENQWIWLNDSQFKGHRKVEVKRREPGKNCAVYKKEMIESDACETMHRWICKRNATTLALSNTTSS
ncbi:CD209 antigen-like protein E [Alligator mississippiensis]|uniref:CD209 antigen-like protein E n=1 Tax=Alligator mississippiensis TaxID=8496 RepID=UPI002877FDC3|nr:CD209 antigen-like protein E [Alligator mississippiensis]